jgi:fructosamine-3-kinase
MDRDLRNALEEAVGAPIEAVASVHGGDTAQAYRVDVRGGTTYFAKTHRSPPPGFFTTEAAGLSWLHDAGAVPVPSVVAVSDGDPGPPFLVLEWVEQGRPTADTEPDLGRRLARLHRAGAPAFGREDRRTTGGLGLPNDPCDTWVDFYAQRRLRPLARIALDRGSLSSAVVSRLERVADRLAEVGGPPEPPARLHGDLGGGNRLVDRAGRSWLIDPAAHGGHREFDLAMMRLFGGFGIDAFAAYADVAPLATGWQERVRLHQIAPLVVHAVKFGGGYVAAATEAIDAYA